MPTYVYETLARDGTPIGERFELEQAMADEPLTKHPETGATVRRVFVPFRIAGKLAPDAEKRGEQLGGSTYTCDVWPGHPFEQELLGQLRAFRERTSELRARIRAHNDSHERPSKYLTVTLYAGQNVLENDSLSAAPPAEPRSAPSPLDPTQELD